jgi:hypothetical protein
LSTVEALKACQKYEAEAKDWLDGRREELPDPAILISTKFPLSTIPAARCGEERGEPFIAAVIKDINAPDEERSERYFDPWYFAAMRLMELSGGRFHFARSKGAKYFYLTYIGPEKKEGNYSLRRMIVNPSPLADIRQTSNADGAHYDYRRSALKATAKSVVRENGQLTRSSSSGRAEAIRFAAELFKVQSQDGVLASSLNLRTSEYEQLLQTAFDLADRIHAELATRLQGQQARPKRAI